jgi:hypothetical protein
MKLAEFDLLEKKVAGLLRLHRELIADNRRLRVKLEDQAREVQALHDARANTELLKGTLTQRLDRVLKELGG